MEGTLPVRQGRHRASSSDIRLRGLAVAGGDAAGRRSPDNHAQTVRNLRRTRRNAATGARLTQPEGLDSKSAGDVAACLADAIEELHRLQRSLDRRIRRDQARRDGPFIQFRLAWGIRLGGGCYIARSIPRSRSQPIPALSVTNSKAPRTTEKISMPNCPLPDRAARRSQLSPAARSVTPM
jgi:hypothetical protein